MKRILFLMVFGVLVGAAMIQTAWAVDAADPFQEVSSEHFRVRFTMSSEREEAKSVLRRAEEYYIRVADDIGYRRYEDFWTWDRRVVIILYPDQYAFTRFTGMPQWSKGFASRDTRLYREHTIVSFSGQSNFNDEILPHEIAHLMLWDYVRTARAVPVWFEEGVAELQESGKADTVQEAMRPVAAQRKHIPFAEFQIMTITGEKDNVKVSLFYAQSLSIVVFLIEKYGRDAFHRLCRELREGVSFELGIERAYPSSVKTIEALEERWLKYLSE